MFSKTLMKQTIKENITLWGVLTGVQVLMIVLMAGAGTNIQAAGLGFYNFLPGLISAIYVIITGNKLLAAQVDKGTMAYVLSTPVTRAKVVRTQAIFFLGSLLAMYALVSVGHIAASWFSTGALSFEDVGIILQLNLGLFFLSMATSGIVFLASCHFNLSKHVTAIGGGLVGAFVLVGMFAMFGFDWLKFFTITTLYSPHNIIAGEGVVMLQFLILAAVGVVTYGLGALSFAKRDLPL